MAEFREPRVHKEVPVRVRGTDYDGNRFSQDTFTLNLSRHGVRLECGGPVKGPGEIVQLQRGWKKAHYQVVWVGEPGTLTQTQIGLQAMDPNKNIWGEKLPPPERVPDLEPESPPPSPLTTSPGPAKPTGKRKVPRYRCSGVAQLWLEGTDAPQGATLEEISVGGCFLETTWPLPVGTRLELLLNIHQTEVHAKGKIVYIDPSLGMGVAFTEVSPADREHVEKVTTRLAARPASN
jgi:hypothetical protein